MERVKMVGRIYLGMIIASISASYLISGIHLQEKSYFLALLINQSLLLLPCIVYMCKYRIPLRQAIRFKKISGKNVFLCIGFAFLIMPVMTLINAISLLFSKLVIQETIQEVVVKYPLILSVFIIAFIPCMFEETIFRGVIYNETRKWNVRGGIILSAFLFGLAHMNFNQFSYAFILGMVFALLIEATDSIVATMIIHFIINANSVILSFASTKFVKLLKSQGLDTGKYDAATSNVVNKQDILTALPGYAIVALVAGTGAFFIFRAIAMDTGRWEHVKAIFSNNKEGLIVDEQVVIENKQYKELTYKSVPWCLIIGITVCLAIMILGELNS